MKKLFSYLKNKFILASTIFFVYALFLDENDIFTMISQSHKLSVLEVKKDDMQSQLDDARATLNKLKEKPEIEKFAREEKFFKKYDEDIFVIFRE
jgi:cell division protein DivIC